MPAFEPGNIAFDATKLAQRIAYTTAGLAEYIGYSEVGAGITEDLWMIYKLPYDSDNLMVSKTWASGNAKFDKVWSSREDYDYS